MRKIRNKKTLNKKNKVKYGSGKTRRHRKILKKVNCSPKPKDELNDLSSNVTSAINTPIMTPKLALTSSVPTLDMCENGVCKLNFENNKNEELEQSEQLTLNCENKDNNITLLNIDKNKLETDKEVTSEKSSPLRYISQQETKRGRPKKNVQSQ